MLKIFKIFAFSKFRFVKVTFSDKLLHNVGVSLKLKFIATLMRLLGRPY